MASDLRSSPRSDHRAFLRGLVPVFMATPKSAWARAGASFVPVSGHATRCPFFLFPDQRELLFGRGPPARKTSTPASFAIASRGARLSPVSCRADAHGAERSNAIREAALDDVLEVDGAEHPFVRRHDQWRTARPGDPIHDAWTGSANCYPVTRHCVGSALAVLGAIHVHAAMRSGRNGTRWRSAARAASTARAGPYFLLGQHDKC